ncbi:MAG: Ger(x)C family spore germination protein, partial [Bacilli bacterium]
MTARTIMFASLILCCFTVSGCWDYKELEQQALLTGLGYDVGDEGDFIAVASFDQPQSSSGDKTPQTAKAPSQIVATRAKHALEAYHLLSLQVPQFKYVSHLYSMVFSEAFAKSSSFPEIVDRITRIGSVRRRMILLVTPAHTKDVFEQRIPGADSTARGLPDLVTQGYLLQMVPRIDMNEFVFQSTLPGVDAILPTIHISTSNGHRVLKAAGAAVFHRMKMVGCLTSEDVRSLLWLMGKSGHSFLAFPGFKKGEAAYFRTEEVKTSIKTLMRGDRPVADVKVQL